MRGTGNQKLLSCLCHRLASVGCINWLKTFKMLSNLNAQAEGLCLDNISVFLQRKPRVCAGEFVPKALAIPSEAGLPNPEPVLFSLHVLCCASAGGQGGVPFVCRKRKLEGDSGNEQKSKRPSNADELLSIEMLFSALLE